MKKTLLVLLLIMFSVSSYAGKKKLLDIPIDAEAFLSAGFSQMTNSDWDKTVTIINYSVEALGMFPFSMLTKDELIGRFSAGLGLGLRFVTHQSEVTAKTGNVRGTRFEVLFPSVAYKIDNKMNALVEYIAFAPYSLSLQTSEGKSISYTQSFGIRMRGDYDILPEYHIAVGPFLDFYSYNKATHGDTKVDLKNSINAWCFGVGVKGYL